MNWRTIALVILLMHATGLSTSNNDLIVEFSPPSTQDELPRFLRNHSNWAYEQLQNLSLEEKIAQSLMVATWPNKGESHQNEIDSLIEHYKIGGLIYFQGDWQNTKESIEHFQSKSDLPLLMGMDAEWGAAMRLWQLERFPFQLTMGAANLPKQTEIIAQAIARELRLLGIHLNFSPVMDVNSNPENPVINFRSFGESALTTANLGTAMIKGMESQQIMSCMKHFPGHGDTDVDSHLDLPVVNKSLRELEIVDWAPFKMGRLAGASSVMMAHLNVPALDSSGTPSSLSKKIIKEYLIDKLKFSGLIISDALNMKAVTDRYGAVEVVVKAYDAGNDILLYPSKIQESIVAIKEKVIAGEISEDVVNERCLKILKAKYHSILKEINHKEIDPHALEYAKTAIHEKAITVLKNDGGIPIKEVNKRIASVTVGIKGGAFDERLETYANADYFHAFSGDEVKNRLLDTLSTYDVVVLNLHASSMLPSNNYNYPKGWKLLLEEFPTKPSSIVNFFGNPYGVDSDSYFNRINSVVLAFENSERAQERTAQLVFGAFQGKTKLPVSIANVYPEGYGVETPIASRLKYTVPEELGISRKKLAEIDSIAINGIKEGAYPGCQVVAAKDGKLFYQKSFGYFTYDSLKGVNNETVYDIASITKIASSTIGLMKLQDKGKFKLDSKLKDYLPDLTSDSPHKDIILKDMMAHQAGLTPWIPFYIKTVEDGVPTPRLYSRVKNDSMQRIVADSLYILNTYEDTMYQRILSSIKRPRNKYRYSDVGYYYIKRIVEKLLNKGIDDYVTDSFYVPMGLKTLRYNPLNHYSKENIAPTEVDTYFRNQLIHGYVHDMGAAMMDGVGGHAGLFCNATDLASLMQMLLNNGVYGGKRYLSEEVIKEYTSCQFCPNNRRGAGFDKPVRDFDGGPTCKLVSLSSYGHSGFTGTQTWLDPEHGINYVFLSNRVYPSGENWKIVKMNIRTEIQRVIYEAVQDARF